MSDKAGPRHQQPSWPPPITPEQSQGGPNLIGYAGQPMAAARAVQPAQAAQPVKHRRRVFWWFFAALQLAFVVWVVAGGVSASNETTDAGRAGGTIGVGLIILLWALVDVIVGITYAVYRFASRDK
ncbi:hypothetical protein ACFC6L_07110 [Kitasatospora phosalacinea]|uniref:hypothetical protein n=1 Tax=Kitasatospora phosalacinea TaxID=2065 RepID=UPI0035DE4B86